ncbi:MAG: aldo/keto reductase [Planctomycetota bacterium]
MAGTPIGTSGLELPRVIFGSSNLGNLFTAHSDETKLAIAKAWFDHADTPVMVDTAGKYGAGLALESIGKNLRELGVPPENIIINNKLGWARTPLTTPEPTFEPGAWVGLEHDAVQKISRDGILECWREGDALLGAPYASATASVHDPDEYLAAASDDADRERRLRDVLEAYEALAELRESGRIAAVGIGAKDWRVIEELDRHVAFDWVMIANSLTIYSHPTDLLAFLDRLEGKGVPVINSAVFHAGFLVGGAYFDYRAVDPADPDDAKLLAWRAKFHELCTRHDVPPGVACVRFAVAPAAVKSIAVNSSRAERLAQFVDAVDADVPAGLWADLKTEGLIRDDFPIG